MVNRIKTAWKAWQLKRADRRLFQGKSQAEQLATIETFKFGIENYRLVKGQYIRKASKP